MSFNLDSPFASSDIPAQASVYRSVRNRIRNIRDLRKQQRELVKTQSELLITPEAIRNMYERHLSSSTTPSRLAETDNDGIMRNANAAWAWLLQVLDCHELLFTREFEMRMFRSAIEKQLAGQDGDWGERESLYMALTNGELPLRERLEAGFAVALHYDLATRLKDVSEQARMRVDQIQRAKTKDAMLDKIRETIVERLENIVVDDFVCAVPLQEIRKTNSSIIDNNAGCCSICQSSYTSLRDKPIHDLLSDFPVRIKYCGHIFGKACLEQWMATPKVDEAKYPFRTCPTCRVQIEDVAKIPSLPQQLLLHLKSNARALATIGDLTVNFNADMEECISAVKQAMSDEISAEQLLAELPADPIRYGTERALLNAKLEAVGRERWAWGFLGDRLWKRLRDEWMTSGTKK